MFFKQFYLRALGHASYLIGSEQTGQMLALDVRRDVDEYFAEARSQGMRIAYAADTHQHNDYVSGICELPQHDDVQLLAGARAELGYSVRHLHDGQRFEMGELELQFLHTPGHTPEHVALLVTDRARGEAPVMLMSGGALLVDDVARVDLVGGEQQTRKNAASLCHTLQEKILTLPDYVEVYPTHVAGSLCGGHIGSRLSTTIGYERRMNKLLSSLEHSDRFVKHCLDLSNQPAVPPYWSRMRRLNSDGPPILGLLADPPPLSVAQFERARDNGATVLDCRSPEAFNEHIPGAFNVGAGDSFPAWAGTVLSEDSRVVLVLDSPRELWEVCWHLLRTGFELPLGWLAGGMTAWRSAGKVTEFLPQWNVYTLAHHSTLVHKKVYILDVRQPAEWSEGHIPEAHHITGAQLAERMAEVPDKETVAVVCSSGYRSSVAASLLKKHGRHNVVNVLGGMAAWKAADFETVAEG